MGHTLALGEGWPPIDLALAVGVGVTRGGPAVGQ